MSWASAIRRVSLSICVLFALAFLFQDGPALANVSAAKSRVMQARMMLEGGRSLDEVEAKLREAEKFLEGDSEAEKAPILEQIKAFRAEFAGKGGKEATPAAPPKASAAPAEPVNLSAAKSRVSQARMVLERGQADEAEAKLKEAEGFLAGGSEAETASLREEIEGLRAEIAGQAKPAAPRPAAGAQQAAPAQPVNLSAARSRVMTARMALERGQADEAETKLKEAEGYLAGGSEAETAAARQEIAAIRAELAAAGNARHAKAVEQARAKLATARKELAEGWDNRAPATADEAEQMLRDVPDGMKAGLLAEIMAFKETLPKPKSEAARTIEERLTRYLSSAESSIEAHPQFATDLLSQSAALLAESDTRTTLDAATLAALEDRLADVRAKHARSQKAGGLDRADRWAKDLEAMLVADPYGDVDEYAANRIYGDLESLLGRARRAIEDLLADDPEVKAFALRLDGLEEKAKLAGDAWGRRKDIASLTLGWESTKPEFEGWQDEAPAAASAVGLKPWHMNRTVTALRRSAYWLDDADNRALLQRYADEAAVKAIRDEAVAIRDGAAAKLNESFNASLAAAEAMALPEREYELAEPRVMAGEAGDVFAGLPYAEANVARATALDAKWKAEIAAIEAALAAELKKMTAEATAAWPAIDRATGARDDFHPANAASFVGQRIRLKGVRNRTGWDFDSEYGFAMWFDSMPLAGDYDDKVHAALTEARRRVRRVDDHIDWDVVAVVEGTCRINRRVTTKLIDARTRDVLGKLESLEPMDCVRIKVIALHAGPVAVGP